MRGALVVAASALILCSCGDPVVGTVVEKHVEPQHLIPIVNCTPVGKVTVCNTNYIPEGPYNVLTVRDAAGATHDVHVDGPVYARTYVGARYDGREAS